MTKTVRINELTTGELARHVLSGAILTSGGLELKMTAPDEFKITHKMLASHGSNPSWKEQVLFSSFSDAMIAVVCFRRDAGEEITISSND